MKSGVSNRMPGNAELMAPVFFSRLDAWEAGFCLRCNSIGSMPPVRAYFALVSRLGDGIAWYVMLALLPVWAGVQAAKPALHMGLTALAGVVIYKIIKACLGRERPFTAHAAVKALLPPLDRYSFPSGHTLHATAFCILLAHYYPALLVVALPFAVSVALSRIVLGLHYPTDVLAGALLGAVIAHTSLLFALPG